MLWSHSVRQLRCQGNQPRPRMLLHLFESQLLEIESRRQHKASFAKEDFNELTELKVIESPVLLPPQSWNCRGSDFRASILFHGEVDAEKWISQIRHGINIRAECVGRLVRIEIKALERKNAISFRKPKIKSDLVSIESSRVDNMAGGKAPL